MVKLIAIDIDGTLLDSQLRISKANKAAINMALDRNIQVVLCTGRPTPAATQSTKELGLYGQDGFLITYHGAVTSKLTDMSRTDTFSLEASDVKALFDFAQAQGVQAYAVSDSAMVSTDDKPTPIALRESELMNVPIIVSDQEHLEGSDKFMLMDDPAVIDQAEANLPTELVDRFTVLRSEPQFLEFIHKDSDKGTATELLAKKLGIPLSEVMGIGDGGNDIHLIETCGIGVAMGNAIAAVKDRADFITDTNDQDGVAKAIEKFVLT